MEEPEGGRALRAPVDTQPQHRPRGLRGAVPSADRGGVWGMVGVWWGGVVGGGGVGWWGDGGRVGWWGWGGGYRGRLGGRKGSFGCEVRDGSRTTK